MSGIAPALPSERNSYYAGKERGGGDGGSVISGLHGHGRNDSVTGSIGGVAGAGSPLVSPLPREVAVQQPSSSGRGSGYGDADIEGEEPEEVDTEGDKKGNGKEKEKAKENLGAVEEDGKVT
jgi:hypothetical protein